MVLYEIMSVSKIYMLFNGRFPSEKAAALFAAKSAEAFERKGITVVLIAPYRFCKSTETYDIYYGIKKSFKVRFLPTVDLFQIPIISKIAFFVHIVCFSFSIFIFSLLKYQERKSSLFYSDSLFLLMGPSLIYNTFYELHDFPERKKTVYQFFLGRICNILSTNKWKADALTKKFLLPHSRILVEPNAVDLEDMPVHTKEEARSLLAITVTKPLIVYTGHLYSWKGVDTLADAAILLPQYQWVFVGGTVEDVSIYKDKYPTLEKSFIGHVSHDNALLWQSAADVLVLPNTAKEKISTYYTSPMKLFEYLASRRIVVASRLPSIEAIVGDSDDAPVIWAEADNPTSFKSAIMIAVESKDIETKISLAFDIMKKHSWEQRAERILSWINNKQ